MQLVADRRQICGQPPWGFVGRRTARAAWFGWSWPRSYLDGDPDPLAWAAVPATDDTNDDGDPLDVVCLGNALVDVLAYTTDEDLDRLELDKGSMALVDLARAAQIYAGMQSTIEVSGGSAANTTAGVAALGGRAGYIGKVAADELGEIFVHDMSVLGVELGERVRDGATRKLRAAPPEGSVDESQGDDDATGRSLVLVTPDGERTMATHLGVASTLAPDDLDQDLLARRRDRVCRGLSVGHGCC